VESITSWVTAREGKAVEVAVWGLEEELEENGEDSYGVRLGANSSVVVTFGGVGDMVLVVGGIEVLTIPTRGEIHLRSQSTAVTSGESSVLSVGSINAHDGDGLLGKISVVLGTSAGISSNHSEPIGESQGDEVPVTTVHIRGVVATSSLVVYSGEFPSDQLPHFVCSLMVQRGHPIVAVVNFLVTGGGGGILSISASHGTSEGISSNDGVEVRAWDTRVHDRVRPLDGKGHTVHCKSVTIESNH